MIPNLESPRLSWRVDSTGIEKIRQKSCYVCREHLLRQTGELLLNEL